MIRMSRLLFRPVNVCAGARNRFFQHGAIKTHAPNNLEKRFLVWSGKYKQVADIPAYISAEEMERCRNKVRIRLANIMMGLTVIGCILMVYSGKQAAKRGDSVVKQNIDWHKKYNEENRDSATKPN